MSMEEEEIRRIAQESKPQAQQAPPPPQQPAQQQRRSVAAPPPLPAMPGTRPASSQGTAGQPAAGPAAQAASTGKGLGKKASSGRGKAQAVAAPPLPAGFAPAANGPATAAQQAEGAQQAQQAQQARPQRRLRAGFGAYAPPPSRSSPLPDEAAAEASAAGAPQAATQQEAPQQVPAPGKPPGGARVLQAAKPRAVKAAKRRAAGPAGSEEHAQAGPVPDVAATTQEQQQQQAAPAQQQGFEQSHSQAAVHGQPAAYAQQAHDGYVQGYGQVVYGHPAGYEQAPAPAAEPAAPATGTPASGAHPPAGPPLPAHLLEHPRAPQAPQAAQHWQQPQYQVYAAPRLQYQPVVYAPQQAQQHISDGQPIQVRPLRGGHAWGAGNGCLLVILCLHCLRRPWLCPSCRPQLLSRALFAPPVQFQYQPPEAAGPQPAHVHFSEHTPAAAASAAEPGGQGGEQRYVAYSYAPQYAAAGQYAGQYGAQYAYPQQGQPVGSHQAQYQQQGGQPYAVSYSSAQYGMPAQQAEQVQQGQQREQAVAVAAHTISPDSAPSHAQQPAVAASYDSASDPSSASSVGHAQTQPVTPAAAPPPTAPRPMYQPLAAFKGSRPGSSMGAYNPLAHASGRGSAASSGTGGPANPALAHLFPGAR